MLGGTGWLRFDFPYAHARPSGCSIEFGDATTVGSLPTSTFNFPAMNHYALEVDRFSRLLLGEDVPSWPIEDAVYTLRTIESLFESARSGKWLQRAGALVGPTAQRGFFLDDKDAFLMTVALSLLIIRAHARELPQQANNNKTVWDGVYSEAQAARGGTLYNASCSGCHRRDLSGFEGALKGQRFMDHWREDSLDSSVFQHLEIHAAKRPWVL